MSAFVLTQAAAAAGAAAFGLLALLPSLLVRADNRGLGGFCADFAGIAGVCAMFLLSCHLFASGAVNFYCAACFAAGLVTGRLLFRRVEPRLTAVFSPLVAAIAKRREQALEARRRRFAEREEQRAAERNEREKRKTAEREERGKRKAAARAERDKTRLAAQSQREKRKKASRTGGNGENKCAAKARCKAGSERAERAREAV